MKLNLYRNYEHSSLLNTHANKNNEMKYRFLLVIKRVTLSYKQKKKKKKEKKKCMYV